VNATAIGAYAIVGQSNSLVLGGTGDYGVKVGIGTPTPSAKLDVIGAVKITDGTQGASKVLTSDANGLASWQVPASSSSAWLLTGNAGTVAGTNFIGTTDSKAFDIRTDNLLRTRITTKGAIETYNTGYSVFLGEGAGANDDLTANNNVAVGFRSLYNNTVRGNLVAVGDSALFNNGIGATGAAQASGNTAIGSKALFANTTGRDNTANGNDALYSNTTGYNNTANGKSALYSNSSGNYNTANGINALTSNATGNLNTANGANSLYSNIGGHSNTAIGTDALYNNTTGSNNTALGYQAEVGSNNLTNVTVVGATAVASASNQVRLGNGAVTTLYCMGAYTGTVGTTNRDLFVDNNGKIGYTSSSARYKDNITNLESVDWLYQLRPVNFTYKTDENKVKQYGLIAEEVQKVKPEFVSYNQDGRPETVSYSSMISPLIKALQEQRALNESQQKQIDELKSMVRELMSQK
jgi:hypothetical protein